MIFKIIISLIILVIVMYVDYKKYEKTVYRKRAYYENKRNIISIIEKLGVKFSNDEVRDLAIQSMLEIEFYESV